MLKAAEPTSANWTRTVLTTRRRIASHSARIAGDTSTLFFPGLISGLNLGNSLWHSGTLAAAKQAALLGARGIAFSTKVSDDREPDFSALEPHIANVLDLLMPNKTLSLVNVNLPDKPKGIRWTSQSVRHYDGKVVPDKDPMGRSIFWFTVTPLEGAAKGTDRWAIEHHLVSITPCVSISQMRQILLALWPSQIRRL